MIELQGKYNSAIVYADSIDETTNAQILRMLNHPALDGGKVRIMPDCHAGSGCCIGFTQEIVDKVCVNFVGVDQGCGVTTMGFEGIQHLSQDDLEELDRTIRKYIPSGFAPHKTPVVEELPNYLGDRIKNVIERIGYEKDPMLQIGTLGGGNHFIEAGFSDKPVNGKNFWITVHSGSRNFGLSIANYYQKRAVQHVQEKYPDFSSMKDLAFLERGTQDFEDYLYAMDVAQEYAHFNRMVIFAQITKRFHKVNSPAPMIIESVHNYIDLDSSILRKGAISAKQDDPVLIPFNMRDGMIIGKGKGNPDWNVSAPHGAGRLLARGKAKQELSMDQFKSDMDGIYTTCVSQSTLDESPAAYKNTDVIVAAIHPTVEIVSWIKPVYNFKASE